MRDLCRSWLRNGVETAALDGSTPLKTTTAIIELEDHGGENQAATLANLRRSDPCTGGFELAGLMSPAVTDDGAPH